MAVTLDLAIKAIRAGRKEEGRQLLNLLIQQDPNDDMAWLWMSSVVDTDEQRARCLYHVLAINPASDIARRGLKVLGIVVSDSRPVKVPRDSQPIKIPRPSQNPGQFPAPDAAQTDSRPTPAAERRPFRIDPKAIVDELPFTPIKAPFSDAGSEGQTESAAEPTAGQAQPPAQAGQSPPPAAASDPAGAAPAPASSAGAGQTPPEPAPALQAPAQTQPMPAAGQDQSPSEPVPASQTQQMPPAAQEQHPSEPVQPVQPDAGAPASPQGTQGQTPSEPAPVAQPQPGSQPQPQAQRGQAQNPSEPVPAVSSNAGAQPPQNEQGRPPSEPVPPVQPPAQMGQAAQSPAQAQTTGSLNAPQQEPAAQQPYGGSGVPTDTRPSQPVPVTHSQATMGMPYPGSYFAAGQPYQPQPAPGPAAFHSQMTAGMPTQYVQQQHPSQPMPAVHSNSTLGMPMTGQPPGQFNNQGQHPSEPVPVVQNNMGAGPGQAQFQQPLSQPGALHSNSTMGMPMGYNPGAGPPAPSTQDYRSLDNSQPGAGAKKGPENESDDGEEVNILAVIIFGSLSITALGGLGMLILLMFTTG